MNPAELKKTFGILAEASQITQISPEIFNPLNEYLKEFQESLKAIQESLKPVIEYQEQIQNSLRPVISQMESCRNHLAFIGMSNQVGRSLVSFFSPQQEFFIKWAQSSLDIAQRESNALMVLAKHDWFFDWDAPLSYLWDLEADFLSGNIEKAENSLKEYYKDQLHIIENVINRECPHRSKIITSAFDAHRNGYYDLSILSMLSQADGICKDRTGCQLFNKQNGKPALFKYITDRFGNNRASFTAASLHPLTQVLPINASEKDRTVHFSQLNRHLILHGESLDYGTEINSLKVISLLKYVVDALKNKDEDLEE